MKKNSYDHYIRYIPGVRFWIITTGVIIAFTALKSASQIVNTILLAAFLTAISLAPLNWLKKKGVNNIVANFIIVLSIIAMIGLIGIIIGETVFSFSDKLPVYQERFHELFTNTMNNLADYGLIEKETSDPDNFKAVKILPAAAPIASKVGKVIADAFIVFFMFIFMLFEAEQFSKKMAYISKSSSKDSDLIIKKLGHYFGIKTLTSLATGLIVSLSMYVIGVEFPILWGFIAFILNYIPSIGSIIAAIPAVLIAFIMHGPFTGFITIIIYLVVNTLIGSVIEPQLMGKNLGISPLIVFVSMIFFGYLLGPIGMLIATPLAIVIKIIFDSRDVTKNLGIMIGDGREINEPPSETQD